MKKIVFSVLTMASVATFATAQNLNDGITALYYEKYTKATQIMEQLVAKDPNNAEAVYWLGQVYMNNTSGEANGVQKAAALYQKTTAAGINSPWLLVGLGQVDYINHQNDAAEQKFEQASNGSYFKGKSKDLDQAKILTAIGRASAYGNKDVGDPAYAIPALQKALTLDKTSPEADLYLGINFLKMGGDQGGNAYNAFNDAVQRNPKYAAAYFQMGLIWHAQDNFEAMDEWYQKGITADPAYAPIYLDYFKYWRTRDISKAKGYLDKYVTNSDGGCDMQYYQANFLFESGNYQESIAKAKDMESGSCASFAHLPLLFAMNYHRLNDSAQAVTYANKFFATMSMFDAWDYAYGGFIYMNVTGLEDTAAAYLIKAYDLDTMPSERAIFADSIAYALNRSGNLQAKYNWDRKLFDAKDSASDNYNIAMFNVGYDALQLAPANRAYYGTADSIFTIYKTKYPDQIFGYRFLATSKLMQGDTTAATPYVLDYINIMSKNKDTATYNSVIEGQYYVLALYYLNSKQDYQTALPYLQAMYAIDPTNDGIKQTIDQIQAALKKK